MNQLANGLTFYRIGFHQSVKFILRAIVITINACSIFNINALTVRTEADGLDVG